MYHQNIILKNNRTQNTSNKKMIYDLLYIRNTIKIKKNCMLFYYITKKVSKSKYDR